MSLWAEVTRGGSKDDSQPSQTERSETKMGDVAAGKALIRKTIDRISEAWSEVEHSGGSVAWEWILRGSHHGTKIQKAEDLINTIGSRGDPAALASACNAWVSAWRDGIEAWKKKAASGM